MFSKGLGLLLCLCILSCFPFTSCSAETQNPEIQELVEQLLAAKSENARLAILKANRQKLHQQLLSVLSSTADRFRLNGENSKSLNAYESLYAISEMIGDSAAKSEAWRGIGQIYFVRSEYDQAMQYFQKALQLSETQNDQEGKAESLRLISKVHAVHGEPDEQLKCLEESLSIEESTGNKAGVAKSLLGVAICHIEGEDQERGAEELKRTIEYSEQTGDEITLASALNSLGLYYSYRGDMQAALKCFERSKAFYEASGYIAGLSNNLHNIANVYSAKGNNIEAFRYHLASLKLRKKLQSKRGVAISQWEIGNLYVDQGQLDLALGYLNQSYKILKDENDPYFSSLVLSDIGTAYFVSNQPVKALSYFEMALKEFGTSVSESDTAHTLYSMGKAYASMKQFDTALEFYRKAYLSLKDQWIFTKVSILDGMAWAEHAIGRNQQSLQHVNEGIQLARTHEFQELLWSSLFCKAKVDFALEEPGDGKIALKESIQILENLREQVAGGEAERESYLETRLEPYAAMIELLIGENKNDEAFQFAERSKAKVLLDVIQNGPLNLTESMTAEEEAEEKKLIEELYVLNVKFREITSSKKPDASAMRLLKTKLDQARLDHEAFQTKLYALHPELKIQHGETEIVDLRKANTLLPDKNSAFIEYVVSKNKVFLFLLTASKNDVYEIKTSEEELNKAVTAFRAQISKRDPAFRSSAKQLYRLLISPVEPRIKEIQNTVIIPDGILWELPFQALVSGKDRYFLENTAISYAPSISAFGEMGKIRQKHRSNPDVIAFANPSFDQETAEKVEFVFRDAKLHSLPESEMEVKKLAALYGKDRTSIYIGSDAKESILKQQIKKYGIIHLATHGILNESSPMYSHLLFSRSGNSDPEDGLLEAWEIMNMKLHADLVVLSACETARGRISKGEGMIGLNWAFFIAGCPTTVVSQWKVESSSTAEFMFRFHQNLQKRRTSRSQALRDAALPFLKNPDYRHPFYWASFIVVGNPS